MGDLHDVAALKTFSDDLGQGNVAAALKAGMKCAGVKVIDIMGTPHAVVPEGVELEDMERLLPRPARIRNGRKFEEPDSFCKYVGQFKSESTRLYGEPDEQSILAVIDDHRKDEPSWGEHKPLLDLKMSPEWNEWMDACGKQLSQQDLAEFFDEHMEQIARPDASELLSDIRSIHVSSNTRCDSVQREGGDIAFSFSTETAAGTRTERGKIPSRLVLMIAPFRSWHLVQMTVTLNYRLNKEKGLGFVMRPHQSDQLLNQSFHDIRGHVERELGLPVLI